MQAYNNLTAIIIHQASQYQNITYFIIFMNIKHREKSIKGIKKEASKSTP